MKEWIGIMAGGVVAFIVGYTVDNFILAMLLGVGLGYGTYYVVDALVNKDDGWY